MTADGNRTFSAFLLRFLFFGSSALWSAFFVGDATPVSGVSVNLLETPRQTDTHKISMRTRPIQAVTRSTHGAHTSGFKPKSIPSSDFRKTRPDDRISRTYPVICSACCETISCQPGAIAMRYDGTGGWPFTKSVLCYNFTGKRHCFDSPSPACQRWLRLLLLLWLSAHHQVKMHELTRQRRHLQDWIWIALLGLRTNSWNSRMYYVFCFILLPLSGLLLTTFVLMLIFHV